MAVRHRRLDITLDIRTIALLDTLVSRSYRNRSQSIEELIHAWSASGYRDPYEITEQHRGYADDHTHCLTEAELGIMLDDMKVHMIEPMTALRNLIELYNKCRKKYPKNADRMIEMALSGNYNPS